MRSLVKMSAVLATALVLVACGDKDQESALDSAIEATKEAASDAVEATTDVVNDATEAAGDAVEAVGDADGCQAGKREYFCKQGKDKGLSLAIETGFEYSG